MLKALCRDLDNYSPSIISETPRDTAVLDKTRVYLVGHMEYLPGQGRHWRNKVKESLSKLGIVCFDPYEKPFLCDVPENDDVIQDRRSRLALGDFDSVASEMKQIRSYDLNLCDRSDFIFACINPSVASWGSAEEIVTANRMKKPIFLVVEGGKSKTPLWLMGTIPHKYIYDSVDEALAVIEGIHNGSVAIDSSRWRLLEKSYR